MPVPYLACMALTAQFYALPPRVLPSIQSVEGGRPGLVHTNNNGTADLGLMQINTSWVAAITQVTGGTERRTADRLINDPCFSIAAAGAIMRAYLVETNGNLMQAIGDYHSHSLPLNQAYQAMVYRSAARLFK